MKTYVQKPADVKREWHVVDVKGKVLGRIATEIATLLMGKNKPTFTSNVDGGDFVVVINAKEIEVTRNKNNTKMYYRHSGLPGGLTEQTFDELLAKKPTKIIELAVYNMLPKNTLRAGRMARLKIYADAEHKHQAQVETK